MGALVDRNFDRLVKALSSLEHAKEGKCAVCNARTFRDAAVLLREGCWIAPASFHEPGCLLAKAMKDIEQLSIPEEKEDERIWKKEFFASEEYKTFMEELKAITKRMT